MSLLGVSANNMILPMTKRIGLYVEGQRCAFSGATLYIEDGVVPVMELSVPATAMLRDLKQRARVHLLVREHVKDRWVVPFEGEVMTRGYGRDVASNDLTFTVHHVTGHFDQYALNALTAGDATSMTLQGVQAVQEAEGNVVFGDIMEYFQHAKIRAILKARAGIDIATDDDVTFPQFIQGAFLIYNEVVQNSRIARAYPAQAVQFHRLANRIISPDNTLFEWRDYYKEYMGAVTNFGLRDLGGRITFFELLRTVAASFLHQVTIVPNAETFKKQIQIKPMLAFNAVPPCNVIYPKLIGGYRFEENYANRPTRQEGHFYPLWDVNGQAVKDMARDYTVFAPGEAQYLWNKIQKSFNDNAPTRSTSIAGTTQDGVIFTKPADGIDFVTYEEETRGIITGYYEVPRIMMIALMAKALVATEQVNSNMPVAADGEESTIAQRAIASDDPKDRLLKYKAFLCLTLGDGGGIGAKQFGGAPAAGQYRHENVDLFKLMGDNELPGVVKIHPRRLVFMPSSLHLQIQNMASGAKHPSGKRYRSVVRDNTRLALIKSGVNFYIGGNGEIVQVMPRHMNSFAEPRALPYGITVKGLSAADAMAINAAMLPFGDSKASTAARQRVAFVMENYTETARGVVVGGVGNAVRDWAPELTAAGKTRPVAENLGTQPHGWNLGNFHLGPADTTIEGQWVNGAMVDSRTWEVVRKPGILGGYQLDANGQAIPLYPKPTKAQFDEIIKQDTLVRVQNLDRSGHEMGAAFEARVLDAYTQQVGDNDRVYYLRLDKPAFYRGGRSLVEVVYTPDATADKLPFRPWVVMPGGTKLAKGPKSEVTQAQLDNLKGKLTADFVSGGNTGNLVVAFESKDGSVTDAQLQAAIWLSAVVMELSSEIVGTSQEAGRYARAQARRKAGLSIYPTDLVDASDCFTDRAFPRFTVPVAARVAASAESLADLFYSDFSKLDADLRKGITHVVSDVAFDPVKNAGSDNLPNSSNNASTASARASAAAQAEASQKLDTPEDQKQAFVVDLQSYAKQLIRPIVNFQFYNTRFASQSFGAPMVYSPYALVGYPALVVDGSNMAYNLLAYLHGLTIAFTPESATCQGTFTHVRRGTDAAEKLLPYRAVKNTPVYFPFNLRTTVPGPDGKPMVVALNAGNTMGDPQKLAAYQALLTAEGLVIPAGAQVTCFPTQLVSHEKEKTLCPFLYGGGFGEFASSGDKQPNYTRYLDYTGYVDTTGQANPLDLQNFVFGDDALTNVPHDDVFALFAGEGVGAATARGEVPFSSVNSRAAVPQTFAESYSDTYRIVQEVNQPNEALAGSSLVLTALDPEGILADRAMGEPPDSIYVLRRGLDPSFFDAQGRLVKTIPALGAVEAATDVLMRFDSDTALRVLAHTALCQEQGVYPV